MATKSIYKNVVVKDKAFSRALVKALETAKDKKTKDVQISRTFSDAKREQIKDIFKEKP